MRPMPPHLEHLPSCRFVKLSEESPLPSAQGIVALLCPEPENQEEHSVAPVTIDDFVFYWKIHDEGSAQLT